MELPGEKRGSSLMQIFMFYISVKVVFKKRKMSYVLLSLHSHHSLKFVSVVYLLCKHYVIKLGSAHWYSLDSRRY
jgi:hypothetical protein